MVRVDSGKTTANILSVTERHPLDLPNCPDGFVSVRGMTKYFAPVTMFAERGGFSGHVYQPLVNHRMMAFNNLTESRQKGDQAAVPPLVDSMIHPRPNCSFSIGNFMSLYAYEIFESDDATKENKIWSAASLSLVNQAETVNKLTTSTIKGYRARPLTVDGWLRVLEVFAYDRDLSCPEDYVPASEIVSFLEKLGTFDLSSIDGLVAFVEEHRMQWLYEVTNDPLPDQLNRFFSLVRGVMPLRLAAYDGRHRFNLCCYFATGYFKPTPDIVMVRKPFQDMQFPLYEEEEPSFEKCAVFLGQAFVLSQTEPTGGQPTLDFSTVIERLKRSGANTTASASLTVEVSWSTLIPEFVEYLIMEDFDNRLKRYDYDTFWEPSENNGPLRKSRSGRDPNTVLENVSGLFEAFKSFVSSAKDTRERLVIGNAKVTLEEAFDLMDPDKKNNVFTLNMGKGMEPTPPKQVPRDFGAFITMLKLCSDDLDSIESLRHLIELRPSSFPQVEWKEDAKAYFRSFAFLRTWVFGTSNVVTQHLVQRYIIDKAIIQKLLIAKKDKELAEDIKKHTLGQMYPRAEKEGFFKTILDIIGDTKPKKKGKQAAEDSGTWSDGDLRLPRNSSKLTAKLLFACQSVIFRDIVTAIVHYGHNPKFELCGDANHMLQLYIRYVNEALCDILQFSTRSEFASNCFSTRCIFRPG